MYNMTLITFLLLFSSATAAAQTGALYKDLPVGNYSVGFQILSITDSTRIAKPELDYLGQKNEGNRYRQFTVHLWYPAVSDPGKTTLRVEDYAYNNLLPAANAVFPETGKVGSTENIRASIKRWFGNPDDAAWKNFLQLPALATADAAPLPEKFPLLIGMLRPFSTSFTNEVLASNGYVVAMVTAPNFSSFSTAALAQVPDMQLAIYHLRHRIDESRIGVYGFSGAGFVPVLFSMFDQRVKALADLESGIYMKDLHKSLSESNYYMPARLRIPFLHIFSSDLSKQEIHLDELEKKAKFSKRYRLLLNQPALHHWDFATEGYASATVLHLRGTQQDNIKKSFEIANYYLLYFFNAELKGIESSRQFLSAKPKLSGTADSLWSIHTLQALRPAPQTEELELIIRRKGIDEALALLKVTLPTDSSTDLLQGFRLNGLGYNFLAEKKYNEAIGVFRLNTELHPGDANFFDSLAEAYEASGNREEMKKTAKMTLDLLSKKTVFTDAEKSLNERALKRLGAQ